MSVYDKENSTVTENDSRIIKPGERNINQLGNYMEIKYVINLICLTCSPSSGVGDFYMICNKFDMLDMLSLQWSWRFLYDKNAFFQRGEKSYTCMSYRICPFKSNFHVSCFTPVSRILEFLFSVI